MNHRRFDELMQAACELEWDRPASGVHPSVLLLDKLAARPDLIMERLLALPSLSELWTASDHDVRYGMTKFVLHDDPGKQYRLRLHVFTPGTPEIPHSHRCSFAAKVLRGGYRHVLYNGLDRDGLFTPDKKHFHVLWEQGVHEGGSYYLHHSAVHTVHVQDQPAITLMLRGPAMKRSSTTYDVSRDELKRHYSAQDVKAHGEQSLSFRPVTIEDLNRAIGILEGTP